MNEALALTEKVKAICREIVGNQIPEEMPYFESVWTAFWDSLECTTVEQIQEAVSWRLSDDPILHLGAIGGQHDQTVDTFYAIGTLCIATARIVQNASTSDFDKSTVERRQ